MQISWADFEKIVMHAGHILEAKEAKEAIRANKRAYQLLIDFGKIIGVKKSSAHITRLYSCERLIGKKIVAVTNILPKQVGNFISEVLVLGLPDANGNIVLLNTEKNIPNGNRVF